MKKIHADKSKPLHMTDKLFNERWTLPKLTQKERENLNSPATTKGMKSRLKVYRTVKCRPSGLH